MSDSETEAKRTVDDSETESDVEANRNRMLKKRKSERQV